MKGSNLTPISCRMGRAALDWTQARLAAEAHVAVQVILQFENGTSQPRRNNLRGIVLAFETAGVEFLAHGARILVLPPLSPVPIAEA
jgi:transcriptional regulator with XRE-family HTH domain